MIDFPLCVHVLVPGTLWDLVGPPNEYVSLSWADPVTEKPTEEALLETWAVLAPIIVQQAEAMVLGLEFTPSFTSTAEEGFLLEVSYTSHTVSERYANVADTTARLLALNDNPLVQLIRVYDSKASTWDNWRGFLGNLVYQPAWINLFLGCTMGAQSIARVVGDASVYTEYKRVYDALTILTPEQICDKISVRR